MVSYNSYAVGNDPSTNNATGFSARPAGYIGQTYGYEQFGKIAFFWTSTEYNDDFAYVRGISYESANMINTGSLKSSGFPVRCVRD